MLTSRILTTELGSEGKGLREPYSGKLIRI